MCATEESLDVLVTPLTDVGVPHTTTAAAGGDGDAAEGKNAIAIVTRVSFSTGSFLFLSVIGLIIIGKDTLPTELPILPSLGVAVDTIKVDLGAIVSSYVSKIQMKACCFLQS